jgi:hypothetical protein
MTLPGLFDAEDHVTAFKLLAELTVANQAERVVQ